MKTVFCFIAIALSITGSCQKLNIIKDSIMNHYMKSGYANQHFRPSGEENSNGQRQGPWKDYEVMKDYIYVMEDEFPQQVFGNYLIYGEGDYVDGKREGEWQFYVIEDITFKRILQKKLSYVNDKTEGSFKYLYPGGKIGVSGKYQSGMLEGEILSYFESGSLYGTRYYKSGLRIGKHTYLYSNGHMQLEHSFLNDTLNGLYQTNYINGSIQEKFNYSMGEIDGVYRYYYDNGQLWVEKIYEKGLLLNINGSFDQKGKPRDKGTLKDGNGTVKYYTEVGKIYAIETFKDGKKVKNEEF